MRDSRMPSVRILWIFCLVVLCHLGGPALRVMWAANGAVSQAARVPIARLSVPRLRGSTLPHLYDQSVEIGIACQGPGSEADVADGARRACVFLQPDTHSGIHVRLGIWALGTLPTTRPMRT